ncbi:MAG: helix-turn-helix domain-containing protein [Bacteroidota bacterium]
MNNPNKNTHNASKIIQRLKDLTQLKRDTYLADALNVQPTTLSTWKTRNSIDYRLVIDFCKRKGFDLNYVLLGRETSQENSDLKEAAQLLIQEVKGQLSKEIEKVEKYQVDLHEQLEKLKTKEEIEKAKEKIKHVSNNTTS